MPVQSASSMMHWLGPPGRGRPGHKARIAREEQDVHDPATTCSAPRVGNSIPARAAPHRAGEVDQGGRGDTRASIKQRDEARDSLASSEARSWWGWMSCSIACRASLRPRPLAEAEATSSKALAGRARGDQGRLRLDAGSPSRPVCSLAYGAHFSQSARRLPRWQERC
jgi:hypothetical protein